MLLHICMYCRIRDGIRFILNISRLGNAHIQANQPWKLVKGSADEKLVVKPLYCDDDDNTYAH